MGVRLPTAGVNTTPAVIPAAGTEGVIVTSPPINLILDNAQVLLFWFFSFTPGAAVTAMQPRIRRGTTIAGTQTFPIIGGSVIVTAGNLTYLSGCWFDAPGIVAEQQYVLTGLATGGVATSTVQDACLLALVL